MGVVFAPPDVMIQTPADLGKTRCALIGWPLERPAALAISLTSTKLSPTLHSPAQFSYSITNCTKKHGDILRRGLSKPGDLGITMGRYKHGDFLYSPL
jgi:hypothetical protein